MTDRWSQVEIAAFDWNGTLVDDTERAWRATAVLLERRGLRPIDFDEFRDGFELPLGRWMTRVGIEGQEVDAAVREWNAGVASGQARLQVGAADLLERLTKAGIRSIVVSAASPETVMADLVGSKAEPWIEHVIGNAVDKTSALRNAIGRRASTAMYVGDVEYDIVAGRKAGALTVAYTGGYRPRSALERVGPDAVVDRLAEVADLLSV